MPDKEEQHQENEKKIKQLWELVKKLQEENERLKEKVRTFYGH
jgi:predicted transcriptional regulator YdeE